jgi:diaminohydroxyphosphoribosylaminopyrimidine deaminase/5-amino-6-(5-phosphoribosylamino)uracil reductase
MNPPSKNTHDDQQWLLKAIDLSRQCPPSHEAFSVGAIICGADRKLISSGYSRERTASEHAEETAIKKAMEGDLDLSGATIYSSLEPCSPRLSGKTCCTDLIIYAGIKRVVFSLFEPATFVNCTGTARLREHAIEVVILEEFAHLVQQINRQALIG